MNSIPQTVENMAVRENPQHDVLSGGVVDEGSLRVYKEHIRDPDLFHQASVESHAFVRGAGKGQALVLPVVSKVYGHGEVLHNENQFSSSQTATSQTHQSQLKSSL